MKRQEHEEIEKRLADQLLRLERRIAKLHAEREALKNSIAVHRLTNLKRKDPLRKNSFNRFNVENAIIACLNQPRGFASAQTLYSEAKKVAPNLPPGTFRSYVHRLRVNGLIETDTVRGRYKLVRPK